MGPKLEGVYQLDKSNLLKDDLFLVIANRKKPSPKKPKNYLLFKQKAGFKYLSSLFPWEPEAGLKEGLKAFSFDFEGKDYILFIFTFENQAIIQELVENTQFHIPTNSVELG